MTSIKVLCFVLFCFNFVNLYEINGFCGRPEKPLESRLIPDKLLYNEGEEVTFQCNQYWNYLQKKRCIKGKWIGMQFRCGKTVVENDLNYIKVEDISDEESKVIFDTKLTLLPNYKFANSFLSSRYPSTEFQVQSDHIIRWTLRIEKPISLPFFRINFHFRNISVEESLKIELSANATVSPYRQCKHVFRSSKRMWRLGTIVGVDFECNANSDNDYSEDIKSGSNEIIIVTKSSVPITYKLIAIFLAQSYETVDQHICGEPEIPFGQVVRILWPNINYTVECLEDMNYVSPDNPDLPETTIHNRKCVYDMRWNGTYPECTPKAFCSTPNEDKNEINPNYKTIRFDGVYYFNETKWYAIDGTTVAYQCSEPQNQILLGDAIHICKNGQWIGAQPNCLDLSPLIDKKIKNRAIDSEESIESDN